METLIIIRDKAGIQNLTKYLNDKQYVAFDTETTGVLKDSKIIGLSICAEPGIGYYVLISGWDKDLGALVDYETKPFIPDLCRSLQGKSLIMHNGVFDCMMVENNYRVSLIDSLHTDTMILAHILDENRQVGLKELGAALYGQRAKKEQAEMKASVEANGGVLTKEKYEMYKADPELMANYGAKDAILTYNLFFEFVPELVSEGLDAFFYDDECMPLLRGPTYQLNSTGIRIDLDKLQTLKKTLEIEIMALEDFITRETEPHVKAEYPGTNAKTTFNPGSGSQLAWLLFHKLGNVFPKLSDAGKELTRALGLNVPYNNAAKRSFIEVATAQKGFQWRTKGTVWDKKTRKYKGDAKVKDYWTYLSTDKMVLAHFAKKYKWVEKLLECKRLKKLLSTYVEGIEQAVQYGVIYPSFLQHGTTSGRYSCRRPNFQNLPRKDKRVKSLLVARPGNIFVGADYAQLEPRVFASFAKDERLLKCFSDGDDFYSVIGMEVFDKYDCHPRKDDKDPEFFGSKYPKLRDISKVVALSATYGTTAHKMAPTIDKDADEAQRVIDDYFAKFPSVKELMVESHNQTMRDGKVYNLFGRPRRMPAAKEIRELFGEGVAHADLSYEYRNLLNLGINHRIQSTGASIMNRAAIAVCQMCKEAQELDPRWAKVRIVLQVHDELILEGPEELAEDMTAILKHAMENTVTLPGVDLIAEPKAAYSIADLK